VPKSATYLTPGNDQRCIPTGYTVVFGLSASPVFQSVVNLSSWPWAVRAGSLANLGQALQERFGKVPAAGQLYPVLPQLQRTLGYGQWRLLKPRPVPVTKR